ncbi:MAG: hypothetical protein SAJ37_12955 [Oscillatoria sp. PMC 1068.18]|nr:hypothetical protein [Oscillatoria sp. PMC 1076.18]MEC4989631.1 hypothetical protein [Oscillatoria sp. PMC 1068.18]
MKASFLKAGFDETRCRYTLFDNSQGNIYEPYSTFNKIKQETSEPFLILCHQDVLVNQGDNFEQLTKVLTELDNLDSNWAVVGNAGRNQDFKLVAKITDPNFTPHWTGQFPQKVHTLDENFLLIKTTANLFCSPELKGFHFYGTDLCLNAILKGYSCYVVDFHLTHLSKGNADWRYRQIEGEFRKKWTPIFQNCYVQKMFMNNNKLIQYFLEFKPIRLFCWLQPKLKSLFYVYNQFPDSHQS